MLKRFYPNIYVSSIHKINYAELIKKGKTHLLFDLDNTIAPFDIEEPDDETILFFKKLVEKGFKICIISNNKRKRVELFNQSLQLDIFPEAGKPKLKGIKKAIEQIEGTKETTAIIGDQMFTDMWVGNRLGIYSILVKPIANRDEFTVKLKRGAEKKVLKQYIKYKEKNRKYNIYK